MPADNASDHESLRVKPNDKIGIIVAIAACIVYGFYPSASRAAYKCGANAELVLLVTTLARAVGLSLFCLMTRKPMFASWPNTRQSIASGFWQIVSTGCIIYALLTLQGPIVLTLVHTTTIMLLFTLVLKGEMRLYAYTLIALAAMFAGLTYVLDIWHEQPASNWQGYAFALLGAYAATNRLYAYNHQMKVRNPAIVGAESFVCACGFVLVLVLLRNPVFPTSIEGWGWIALGAASLVAGSFGTMYGISLLGSFKWSLFVKLEPVFTCFFAVLFLGEYLKTSQYIGIAVVIGSLIYYQIKSHVPPVTPKTSRTEIAEESCS